MKKFFQKRLVLPVFVTVVLGLSVVGALQLMKKRVVVEQKAISNDAVLSFEVGTPQTVFNSSGDNLPDTPARWFVDKDGKVQMLATHFVGRRSIGDNLNDMSRPSDVVMNSDHDGNIRNYNDAEWLVAPYTLDGQTIYSIIHTEYHGWEHNNCPSGMNAQDCWWNSLNLATSTNAGVSYSHANPPNHNIANTSLEYNPVSGQSAVGYFNPSNIIKKGNYYYFLTGSHNPPSREGTCIMRTNNLTDPQSWKFWNGGGVDDFTLSGDRAICPQLEGPQLQAGQRNRMPNKYVGYNSYLQKYIAFECYEGRGGFCWYALSDDLINWGPNMDIPQLDNKACMYGALVQPGDETRNFEVTDRSPWVYSTRSCGGRGNEGLGRVRLRISKTEDVGKYPLLDLKMSEKRGNKTLDSSFYGNDGTLSNASFGQDGNKNFAHLAGNGEISIGHNDSLNLGDNEDTVTFEVKIRTTITVASGQFATLLIKQTNACDNRNYGLFLSGGNKIHFSGKGCVGSESSVSVPADGNWHTIKVVYTKGVANDEVSYYLDNVFDIARQHPKNGELSLGINNNQLMIGGGFNGDIDEIKILNYSTLATARCDQTCGTAGHPCAWRDGNGVCHTDSAAPGIGWCCYRAPVNCQCQTLFRDNGSSPADSCEYNVPVCTPSPTTTPSAEVIDVLQYMTPAEGREVELCLDNGSGGCNDQSGVGERISNLKIGNYLYTVKWRNPEIYGAYSWDNQYIYLRYDGSWGEDNHNCYAVPKPNPIKIYNVYRNRPWAKRQMRIGERIDSPSDDYLDVTRSDCTKCTEWKEGGYNRLVAHYPQYNLGGTLGVQDVIVIEYNYGDSNANEWTYYAKGWGEVVWERYESGVRKYRIVKNRVSPNSPVYPAGGCGPIPTLTPIPSATPTRVPPTATLTPVPTNTPRPTNTPTPTPDPCRFKYLGDADCSGVVNLLDFEVWRREFIGEYTTKGADFDGDGKVTVVDFEIWRRTINSEN